MRTIGEQTIWSFAAGARQARPTQCTLVRKGKAHHVASFMQLATKVAELQFRNRDYVLLFRGQNAEYRNRQGNTSLKPSLFRPQGVGNPGASLLRRRFALLNRAERELARRYVDHGFLGRENLMRQQILRWSILQHYEVCKTPLLDVTHSLRIAASFASDGAGEEAFIFVLGVPSLSGAITTCAEAGLEIVRLSSVCPPAALRPHIQEGYLLGEYPAMTGYGQKELYAPYEIDFGLRLVAKFSFRPRTFWKSAAFPKVERAALYPDADDPLFKLAREIRSRLPR